MDNHLSAADRAALFNLRWRWAGWALGSLAALGGGYLLFHAGWPESGAAEPQRWLLPAAAGAIYMLLEFWRALKDNRLSDQAPLLPRIGPGTSLTLLRGLLIALLGGFLFLERPPGWLLWIPGLLYTLANITDYLDGYAARVTNLQTRLGERLDMTFDGWGVLVGSTLGVLYGQVPVWYLGVALARPLFLLGIHLRKRLNKPVYPLPHRVERRALAGVQMGFIAVMLWPVFSPPGTHIAAAVFALPFLLGFMRDWLIVSGVIPAGGHSIHRIWPWLPLGLRLSVVALGGAALMTQQAPFAGSMLLALLQAAAVGLIALGASGRTAAIAGLLLLGAQQALGGLGTVQILLIIGYTGVLFFGTGPFSLWTPEERLIHHRAGERDGQLDPEGAA